MPLLVKTILCFQFDALVEKLTGREMLEMFARLRGIPAHKIAPVVNAAIKQLNLANWADKMCGNYRYRTYCLRGW